MSLIPEKEFLQNYSEAVVITNATGEPVFINRAFTGLTGFDNKDVAALRIPEMLDEKNKNSLKEADVIGLTKKDGDRADFKISGSPFTFSDKSEGMVYTFRDYTDVMQLRARLRESDSRLSLIVDSLPVMVYITNANDQAYYFNKTWLDFTGRTIESESGDGWLQNVHPDDLKTIMDQKPDAAKMDTYTSHFRLRRADGVYRVVNGIALPRFLPDKSFAGFITCFSDNGEIQNIRKQLAETSNKLERTTEELEQLAYVASHDLQEPLRTITSYIQLINKNIEKGNAAAVSEFMKFVLDGAARMQGLINDLLQYSRVSKKDAVLTEVDMNKMVKIALANLNKKISESGAVIEISDMPKVMGDSMQLATLMQNLIDNALKFKSPESKPEINISVQDSTAGYIFSVKDNGIGFEEKFYSRIFVIFQRLHGRAEYEGTGLGLAVAKKIVERHGGEIWVESEKGKGSTFYFSLKRYTG